MENYDNMIQDEIVVDWHPLEEKNSLKNDQSYLKKLNEDYKEKIYDGFH
jgi:hypothetical protein